MTCNKCYKNQCLICPPGPQGKPGITGPQGIQGIQGDPGITGAQGIQGIQGIPGLDGLQGVQGISGLEGLKGPQGITGTQGSTGPQGTQGSIGLTGPQGTQGTTGTQGSIGLTGPQGLSGGLISASDFYAIMPGDNSVPIAAGSSVQFPQNGPSFGTISRISSSQFNLPDIGVYTINFEVAIIEAGQLVVVLNGTELPYTVVGRATGTSQIIGLCLVRTTIVNNILSINNPTGNATALTVVPLSGGSRPVSAHLVINRVN